MAEDWDLYAIVRSCTSAINNNTASSRSNNVRSTEPTTPTASTTFDHHKNGNFGNPLDCLAALTFEEDEPFSFPDLEHRKDGILQDLQDSYKPFLGSRTTGQGNILSSSFIPAFEPFTSQNPPQLVPQHPHHLQQQQQQQLPPNIITAISPRFNNNDSQQHHLQIVTQHPQLHQQQQLHQLQAHRPSGSNIPSVFPLRTTMPSQPASRSRKKKSHQKRLVMHLTAENLSNDEWAWRKYGQKPIKGSPYPRNYYRCSSSKGCSARKQVERSNTDPTMFIVSYSGDHTHPRPTHRNSLAGSTRNKFPIIQKKESDPALTPPPPPTADDHPSPVLSVTSLSPTTPLSAAINHEAAAAAAAANENMGAEITRTDIEGHGTESDDADGDDDDDGDGNDDEDDDDNILIPNIAINEDLIKGFEELGGSSRSTGGHQLGHTPAFGGNFSSWTAAAAAGATTSGDF